MSEREKEMLMKKFVEMAHADNPAEIVKATQAAIFAALKSVVVGLKKDMGGSGPTWATLEHLIEEFSKKKLEMIFQEYEA